MTNQYPSIDTSQQPLDEITLADDAQSKLSIDGTGDLPNPSVPSLVDSQSDIATTKKPRKPYTKKQGAKTRPPEIITKEISELQQKIKQLEDEKKYAQEQAQAQYKEDLLKILDAKGLLEFPIELWKQQADVILDLFSQ